MLLGLGAAAELSNNTSIREAGESGQQSRHSRSDVNAPQIKRKEYYIPLTPSISTRGFPFDDVKDIITKNDRQRTTKNESVCSSAAAEYDITHTRNTQSYSR